MVLEHARLERSASRRRPIRRHVPRADGRCRHPRPGSRGPRPRVAAFTAATVLLIRLTHRGRALARRARISPPMPSSTRFARLRGRRPEPPAHDRGECSPGAAAAKHGHGASRKPDPIPPRAGALLRLCDVRSADRGHVDHEAAAAKATSRARLSSRDVLDVGRAFRPTIVITMSEAAGGLTARRARGPPWLRATRTPRRRDRGVSRPPGGITARARFSPLATP